MENWSLLKALWPPETQRRSVLQAAESQFVLFFPVAYFFLPFCGGFCTKVCFVSQKLNNQIHKLKPSQGNLAGSLFTLIASQKKQKKN